MKRIAPRDFGSARVSMIVEPVMHTWLESSTLMPYGTPSSNWQPLTVIRLQSAISSNGWPDAWPSGSSS